MRIRLYKRHDGESLAIVEAFRRTGLPPVQVSGRDPEAYTTALRVVIEAVSLAERAALTPAQG